MNKQIIKFESFPFDAYSINRSNIKHEFGIHTDRDVILFDNDTHKFFIDNDIELCTCSSDEEFTPSIILSEDDLLTERFVDSLPDELIPIKNYIRNEYGSQGKKIFTYIGWFRYRGTSDALAMLKLSYG